MNAEELARKLREVYDREARKGKASMASSLFGIMYADQIRTCGASSTSLVRVADIPRSYSRGIRRGMQLSEYVELRRDVRVDRA